MKRNTVFFTLLLAALLLVACSTGPEPTRLAASTPLADMLASTGGGAPRQLPTPLPQQIIDAADAEYLVLSNVYDRVSPSVVNIEVSYDVPGTAFVDLSRGSGFIYDMQGHIITNAHVVSGGRSIRVTFNDGYVAEAELVGLDTYSDLAVIRVDVPLDRLNPLALADSDLVRVGQRAIAIGNPFGLNSSMTVGIVSGVGRTLRSAELIDINAVPGFQNPSIIQVDTPINPGNSGGPLLNSRGEVIGVNTAIRTDNGVFQGVGFAVPSNTLRRVAPELIENGSVNYAWIGISVMPEEDGFGVSGLAEPLSLPVRSGVLIRGVTVGSPADKAGLLGGERFIEVRDRQVCTGGDIIVAVDGRFVNRMDELVAYLVMHTAPGDTITLRIVRGEDTFEVPVLLEPRPTSGLNVVRGCNLDE